MGTNTYGKVTTLTGTEQEQEHDIADYIVLSTAKGKTAAVCAINESSEESYVVNVYQKGNEGEAMELWLSKEALMNLQQTINLYCGTKGIGKEDDRNELYGKVVSLSISPNLSELTKEVALKALSREPSCRI